MEDEGLFLSDLHPSIVNLIKHDYPKAKINSFICSHHLLKYRMARVDSMINADLKQSQKKLIVN